MLDLTSILMTVAPELWLALAGLTGVLLGAVFGERFNSLSFKFGALSLFAASALAAAHFAGGEAFGGLVRTNTFVNFAKVVSFGLAGFALLISEGFLKRHDTSRYEYALLTIFASLGMGIILSAADLMTLYMGIETLSLSSYVLAAFHRDSARSSEAGLKYFVLGALASGMLLYGASLVYGFTGSTSFSGIAEAGLSNGAMFGMVLIIVGLAFKISAAPMHVWTPDVYEGAPTAVVAFFASAPKLASTVVFANVLFTVFGAAFDQWQLIVAIIAGLSMIIGSLGALLQTNIKRLLGYSSIANVGYALVPVAAGQEAGAAALLTFSTIYAVTTLGLFAGVLAMRRRGGMVEGISELGGLIRTKPLLAVMLSVLIFSIAGLPPFGGFFGKFEVLRAGLNAELVPLAILVVISSVISLGYYLKLIKIMWFDEPTERFEAVDISVMGTVILSAVIAGIVFMIFISELGTGGWGDFRGIGAFALSNTWPVHQMGIIDSTNTEAKRRVVQGFADQWIVADQQTAGRGRQDRQWISPLGNIYATALFREPGGLSVALRLPFAAALAVTDVVIEHAPGTDVRVKWPNDVRIDRRKVSGILVETGGLGADFWVAAGIGINLVPPPANVTQPATSLLDLGMRHGTPIEAVLNSLRGAFARRLLQARDGFTGTRKDWLERAEALGQSVQVRTGDEDSMVEGTFEDLELDGALVLRLPDGSRRSIRAGEVEIRRSC